MVKKWGIDTDEFDKQSREAAEDYVRQQIAKDWSYEELQRRYENLKAVTLKNFPNLWTGLEFTLSVKTVLNIKGNTLPFIGILLGPASSMKTFIIELFREYGPTLYTDYFSPKSLVSHNSGVSEDELREIDLLPKIRNKLFLTPELSPLFGAKEDELNQVIHILIRIADGQGYESDSGAKGHRGYAGDMMFAWIGAAVEIPYRVHKLLGNLGPKLYFLRLPRIEESEDDYFSKRKDNFKLKRDEIKQALYDYLQYFDLNPSIIIEQEDEATRSIWRNGNGNSKNNNKQAGEYHDDLLPPKIEIYEDLHEENAERIIIRLALMLAHLRAIVPTWETYGSQGSEYGFAMPLIEDPTRAMTQMRNLAKTHALSQGRLSFTTMGDIPFIIQVIMSTATKERVRIFELLLANGGMLDTSQIVEYLDVSRPTALRTMTELKVAGLVDIRHEDHYRAERQIVLKDKFKWFLTTEFADLKNGQQKQEQEQEQERTYKEKYPPRKHDEKRESEEQNVDSIQDTRQNGDKNGSIYEGGKFLNSSPSDDNEDDGGIYACSYCEIINQIEGNTNKNTRFPTLNAYEKHIVNSHKGLTFDPEPKDLDKFESDLKSNSNPVADMAEANLSGNGVLGSKDGVSDRN